MKLAAALLFFSSIIFAQAPEVPHKMQFAGITLSIRDDARREIQKDVDMLTQSPRHHNIKVERAKTYFPIIEKIFEEEKVPDDFKYLVLQESALISDAVSVSNAVGFWQFKDFTAIEMGLRVDKEIDERMNIASATRAAARYIKKNNYYFNNWIYALQAYQMGAGGAMKAVKDYQSGTKHMEITSQTYWYVKKYLAHKIAFEGTASGTGEVKVFMVTNRTRKSMSELAKEFALEEDQLKAYNKWVRKEHIPDDKPYMLAIPAIGEGKVATEAIAKANSATPTEPSARVDAKPADARNMIMILNGISAIKAVAGESPATLAKRADVDLSAFLKSNDLSISDRIITGEYYYLKRKKSKGPVASHIVLTGDNLWSISQKYGVQLRKLKKYNKLESKALLSEGSVIYLSSKRTQVNEVALPADILEVAEGETFNWTVQPKAKPMTDVPVTIVVEQSQPAKVSDPIKPDSAKNETILPDQHIVTAGETLYSIAKRYNVGVMDLVEWNTINLTQGIKPGQVLKLRVSSVQQEVPVQTKEEVITHAVKASDTLYSIAREYGVTIKELMDWNQKKDFTLSVGENLKIIRKQ